ncbi:MerR family transcriptional regulator [Nevskia sp.]|uniref:MerR family transcriptional regulator n=1 Tax=Nevskia sp. TaxID=1929292 RepID=UPI0025CF8EEB|nr:MerR family transcriptional regulator [Nevskia sp.]
MSRGPPMKMRELESRTGVTRQMIQFYLANGLLPEPVRPKPNVAEYGEEHVKAIQAIRRLQTDGRLSISEIKQALNGKSATVPTDAAVFPHLDELFASRAGVEAQVVPLSSVKTRNPQAEADARVLEEVGAIKLVKLKGKPHLSNMDAQIVGCWGDMRAAGFTESEGFDPSIVALHVKAAESLASDEVDSFLSRVSPDYSAEKKAAMAQAGSKVMLSLFTLLRMKATISAFKRI